MGAGNVYGVPNIDTYCLHTLGEVIFMDQSLSTGRGGYRMGRGWGASEILPLGKGCCKEVIAILKGGARSVHPLKGGGAQKV